MTNAAPSSPPDAIVKKKHLVEAQAFPLAIQEKVAQELANKERDLLANPPPVVLSQADLEKKSTELDKREADLDKREAALHEPPKSTKGGSK
jgi:hypothetical protein